MIKNIGILSGFISSLFIFLYALMYILRDFYSSSNNNSLKKYINKILPLFSKYNLTFLIVIIIFSIIHVCCFFSLNNLLNSGYVVLFILLLIAKFTFFPSKSNNSNYYFNIFSYLLVGSLIVHFIM
ncbi:hypothetical protein [Romboutsia lituseburensis]|uniref:hypothetical protein n=1 Tax=Romboutsia lituseburensis TaxID=1537 RepID=UPI00215A2E66|nr:hypothetical protein [Romboutsia lituseburensis]MCR8745076.1 hypothetical protein [Romboutsia lituseburensis]